MDKIEAIKQLYAEAEKAYEKSRELHDGEWMNGHMPGHEETLTYMRVLKILEASTDSDIEKYKNMSSLDLIKDWYNGSK